MSSGVLVSVDSGNQMVSGYLDVEEEGKFQKENLIDEIVNEQNVTRDDAVEIVESLLEDEDEEENNQ